MARRKVLVSWSSGKDAALALLEILKRPQVYEVMGLATTVSQEFQRVSMHGVPVDILGLQARAARLPLTIVEIPTPCSNEDYERLMGEALLSLRAEGLQGVVFGDLCIEDIRSYREAQLAKACLEGIFPLWMRETCLVARDILSLGIRARICSVDTRVLDPSFCGRWYDEAFLKDLPPHIDPCRENGEFHTFVTDTPYFSDPISVTGDAVILRDGFAYLDIEET